jgi:3-demethylubiquinone-9 3-methyltransferase
MITPQMCNDISVNSLPDFSPPPIPPLQQNGRRGGEPVLQKIKTLPMSDSRWQEAINFCVSRFPDAAVTNIRRYGAGESGAEGSVKQASFVIQGQTFMAVDSPVKHGFTFTPALPWYR